MKKTTYLFFFAFLCGVICANLLGTASGKEMGAMGEYFANRYLYADIQGREFFLYLFYERVPGFLMLLVLSIGIYGMLVADLYIGYLGFSVGFLSVIAIIHYGLKGILLMAGFLFPHSLLYVPALMLWHCGLRSYKNPRRDRLAGDKKRGRHLRYLLPFVLACVLFLGGLLLESYANPPVLQMILSHF